MPLRGENVGSVYVRVFADGAGLDKDVESELDGLDKEFEEGGKRHGDKYAKGFRTELKKQRPNAEGMRDLLARQAAEARTLADDFARTFGGSLDKSLEREYGKTVGSRVRKMIEQDIIEAGNYTTLFTKVQKDADDDVFEWRINNLNSYVRRAVEGERDITTTTREENRIRAASFDTFAVLALESLDNIEQKMGKIGKASGKKIIPEKEVEDVKKSTRSMGQSIDLFSDRMGRAFGRGGRNDFLNFVGGFVRLSVQFIGVIPRMIGGIVNFGKAFTENIKAGQGIFQSFVGAVSGGAGAFASMASTAALAAVSIPVVVVVVGTLVAILSLLLGVVTALAASLTFALGGALVAVAGLIAPVALGIGVLVASIASLSDAQKNAISTAFRPYLEELKSIGREAATALFGTDQFRDSLDRLGNALTSGQIRTGAVEIAKAIGDIGNGWAVAIDSPGFQKWVATMTRTVPDQIRDLGKVVQNVVGGIGGFFLAAQPFITTFTGYLERVTREFSNWANSADGRREIQRFLERATDSARAVGGFLGQITGLLADLFDAGQSTGDSIFTDLENAVRNFRDYIADGGLEKWFEDTKKFAEDLGQALKAVGEFIDAIDNSFTRLAASGAFEYLEDIFDLLSALVNLDVEGIFTGLVEVILQPFEALGRILLPDAWVDKAESLGSSIVRGIVDWLKNLPKAFTKWFGEAWDEAKEIAADALGFIADLIDKTPLGFVADKLGFGANDALDAYDEVLGGTKIFTDDIARLFEQANGRVKRSFFDAREGAIADGTFIVASMRSASERVVGSLGFAAEQVKLSFFAIGQASLGSSNSIGGNMQAAAASTRSFFAEAGGAVLATFSSMTDASIGTSGQITTSMGDAATNTVSFFEPVGASVSATFDSMALASIGSSDTMTTSMGAASTSMTSFFAKASIDVSAAFGAMAGAASGAADSIVGSMGRAQSSMGGLVGSLGSAKALLDGMGASAGAAAAAIGRIPKVPGSLGTASAVGGVIDPTGNIQREWMAGGGLLNYMQNYRGIIGGEAGREAVVPLDRPLGQVDPSVRALAAFAQGKMDMGTGRTLAIEKGAIQVIGSSDPWQTATLTVNQIVERAVD